MPAREHENDPPRLVADAELMRRVQAGDTDAFGALYDRHVRRAFAVARSVCRDPQQAEDAVQEGFLSVWRSREGYRPARGTFQAWAMTLVRHRAVDRARVESRPARDAVGDLTTFAAADEGPLDERADARGEARTIWQAVQLLPQTQAEVVVLAFYGGLAHSEIAKHLGLPAGTVKGRMRLALKKLRVALDEVGDSTLTAVERPSIRHES